MGIYHITYAPQVKELCLYLDEGCDFYCHGCISRFHLEACYFYGRTIKQTNNKILSLEKTLSLVSHLSFEKVVLLGQEPTRDSVFLSLTRILKKNFSAYISVITNCWRYIEDGIDEVCGSIKAITPRIFKRFTGRDNPIRVLKNFERYAGNPNIKLRAESIFVPDLVAKEEIRKIASFIGSVNNQIPYRIDAYIPIDTYFHEEKDQFRKPTKEEMEEAKQAAGEYLKNISILTREIKPRFEVIRIY